VTAYARSMVDWDRVDQLRQNGWDWDEIAEDPKVGFRVAKGSGDPGRALQVLHRRREGQRDRTEARPARPSQRRAEELDRRWTLARVGYLVTPLVAVWALVAYLAPSPVGLVLPAIPYVALLLAVAAVVLVYGLMRSARRWNRVFRNTVIEGLALGLVFTGVVAIAGIVVFGCPYLPPAASLSSEPGPGWAHAAVPAWQESGNPVVYFYGATWCPYCSASSWAIWKALTEFQVGFGGTVHSIPGTSFQYSSSDPAGPYTPEVVLADAQVTSPAVAFQVSEYQWTNTSGVEGTFPGTSNCVQQAYVSAYSDSSIPFVTVNGQYIHGGSYLVAPSALSAWSDGANGGAATVATDVLQETGTPWAVVQGQAGWICAFVLKSDGCSTVASFLNAYPALGGNADRYQWTPAMTGLVDGDLTQLI